jgi:hypothetical protein
LDMEGKQELEVMVLLQIFLTVEELLLWKAKGKDKLI